jgi:HprK-related kinase A
LIVSELPAGELRRRLRHQGLRLCLGPVAAEVHSPFASVEAGIALHYARHRVVDDDTFADFHVSVEPPFGVRRYVGAQALFRFDAATTFRPLPAAQAFPLLEWGLNWCVSAQCDHYLVLHAAVLERGTGALLLPAPPGSGKSTLCAALVARGWRLLSDELAILDLDAPRVHAMPRPISLKNASIDAIRAFWPGAAIGALVANTLKGTVAHVRPPADSVARARDAAIVRFVVLPEFVRGAPMTMQPLGRAEAFMRLVDSSFNYAVHGRAGFDALGALVAGAQCRTFRYGGGLDEATRAFEALASS